MHLKLLCINLKYHTVVRNSRTGLLVIFNFPKALSISLLILFTVYAVLISLHTMNKNNSETLKIPFQYIHCYICIPIVKYNTKERGYVLSALLNCCRLK